MATPTYTPIASITLGSSASSVTFSSIPQDYRDLVLVVNGTFTSDVVVRFNNDTTSSYSRVVMGGNGSTTEADSATLTYLGGFGTFITNGSYRLNVFDYSATDKHKTCLVRSDNAPSITIAMAGRWADTSAINEIDVFDDSAGTISSGTTLALWGIAS